ncbi:FtsX-like permease family protein [Clostridium paridis]|uniref:FtsX-like permease family protein n=1 Tax=Clostridium paridis TaxID=2803863 RepID=A0A937FEP4_9CLOT|nr:FtsX-like permease family protein [Clostridium paridis]
MSPLSSIKYLMSHKRRTFSIALSISLSILIVFIFQLEIRNMVDGFYLSSNRLKSFSEVKALNGNDAEKLVNKIQQQGNGDKVINTVERSSSYRTGIGTDAELIVYNMTNKDIEYTMKKLSLKLKEGYIDSTKKDGLIISEQVARNKKVKLGDRISKDTDDFFRIDGEYEIRGIYEGNINVAFIPTDQKEIDMIQNKNFLLFFNESNKSQINSSLLSEKSKKYTVTTYETDINDIESFFSSFTIITNIVVFILVMVQGIILGFINYSAYYQRKNEFGVLKALGYSITDIFIKIIKEIFVTTIVGVLFAVVLIILYVVARNIHGFYSGMPAYRVELSDSFKIIPFPMFITLFSIFPIINLIRNADTIAIIEGGR